MEPQPPHSLTHIRGARKRFKAYLAEGVNHLLTATSFRPPARSSFDFLSVCQSACLAACHSAILSS